ncbi:MAG: hypothetical protein N2645_17695 [Clostridia bacterium]|nr:hypothetical protein [Clostridia bacterium]
MKTSKKKNRYFLSWLIYLSFVISLFSTGVQFASAESGICYSISGCIKPDFDFDPTLNTNQDLKSGFLVTIDGTNLSGTTDSFGNFAITNIPEQLSPGYTVRISKPSYLTRTISNVVLSGSAVLGTPSSPLDMWAGDTSWQGSQDNAINMGDILQIISVFNSTLNDSLYVRELDINNDGAVGMADIVIIVKHFNTVPSNYPAVIPLYPTTPGSAAFKEVAAIKNTTAILDINGQVSISGTYYNLKSSPCFFKLAINGLADSTEIIEHIVLDTADSPAIANLFGISNKGNVYYYCFYNRIPPNAPFEPVMKKVQCLENIKDICLTHTTSDHYYDQFLALKNDGTVGRLGHDVDYGTFTLSGSLKISNVTQICNAGYYTSYLLTGEGQVWKDVSGLPQTNLTNIVSLGKNGLFLKEDGTVVNEAGNTIATDIKSCHMSPEATFSSSVGQFNAVFLKKDGSVWQGAFDYKNALPNQLIRFEKVPGLDHITQVSVGRKHYVALKDNGEVYTWGNNSSGQLGIGSFTDSETPVKILPPIEP